MHIVIGATSFIGTYLIDELISQKRDVVATGNSNANLQYFDKLGIKYINLDISNRNDFNVLPNSNIESITLLASLLPANDRECNPQRYIDVNLTGTVNVLEYCRASNVNKIIFATTHSDVAGLWDCGRPISETDPRTISYIGDHAVYVISKIAASEMVEHYSQQYGMQGIVFRLPAVYGFGPHTEIYVDGKRWVPGFTTFIRKAVAGEPIEIWGDPARGRDIIYVKDVVSAFIGAIDSNQARGLYNIASGIRTSLDDEIRAIIEVFSPKEHRSGIVYQPNKADMPFAYLYDISKAKHDLHYEVKYPLMKMLQDFRLEMELGRFPHLLRREIKR
jgi:UDP-glucose 4-epimerase